MTEIHYNSPKLDDLHFTESQGDSKTEIHNQLLIDWKFITIEMIILLNIIFQRPQSTNSAQLNFSNIRHKYYMLNIHIPPNNSTSDKWDVNQYTIHSIRVVKTPKFLCRQQQQSSMKWKHQEYNLTNVTCRDFQMEPKKRRTREKIIVEQELKS